jgi:hypothetical protein
MALTYEESSSRSTNVMYIRGIPFQCPGAGKNARAASPLQEAAARRVRRAETCANRLFARGVAPEESGVGISRAEAQVHAGLMESRRAVRLFTDQGVPMRQLRQLVVAACSNTPAEFRGLARFVVVESGDAMSRTAGEVAAWLRREGMGLDGPGGEPDARRMLFGGAPHVAIAHGPVHSPKSPEACALAVARLEWAAAGAGLGTCFAGELVQAANADSSVAAALAVPHGQAVYAALLIGYPSVAVAKPGTPADTMFIWL